MTKEFLNRVIQEGVLDTLDFRYMAIAKYSHYEIMRLPIAELKTKSKKKWEFVASVEFQEVD